MMQYYFKGKMAVLSLLLTLVCALGKVSDTGLQREEVKDGIQKINAQEDAKNSTGLQLYAQSAVLMDAGSGRILYEKNGHEVRPMASTTKIMTCILALEEGNPEDYVEVSAYAASMPKVKLGMKKGEKYRLKDLLYSLMLESHNDSAVAIAEHIGGSVEGFAGMMNEKAKELDCNDTFFLTPNGLDATEKGGKKIHSTTAADLAKIMSYCITKSPEKEEFLAITGTPSYSFCGYTEKDGETVSNGRNFYCSNHNAFLGMMDGALSGKTGFTGNAGYCYVGSLKRNNRIFVVALLACGWPNNRSYKWSDTRKLMEFGLENFTYHSLEEVKESPADLPPIPVTGAQTSRIGEKMTVPVKIIHRQEEQKATGVLLRENERFEVQKEIKETLQAPVEYGAEAGVINYLLDGVVYDTEHIIAAKEIPKIDIKWCLKQVFHRYAVC